MNKYTVTLSTNYGNLKVEDIESENQQDAIKKAEQLAKEAANHCEFYQICCTYEDKV